MKKAKNQLCAAWGRTGQSGRDSKSQGSEARACLAQGGWRQSRKVSAAGVDGDRRRRWGQREGVGSYALETQGLETIPRA